MPRILILLAVLGVACGSPEAGSPITPPLSPAALATMPVIRFMPLAAWPQASQPFGPVRLAVSRNGTIAVLDPQSGPPFLSLRDSSGRLIARTGNAGEGPGELTGMGQLLSSGDEFLVLDDGRGAVVRYSAHDGKSTGEAPLRIPGFALAVVGDSLDMFDAEFAFREVPPAVMRHAISGAGARTVVSEADSTFRNALGLPLSSRRPVPPPGWYADATTTIWGDGQRYQLVSISGAAHDTIRFSRQVKPNYRGSLGTRMMHAALEKVPQAMRGPKGQPIQLPNVAARLDTLDREVVPYFGASGIGTDAAGRVIVAGTVGDSSFIDVFVSTEFLGRSTLDCFTPAWISVNHGWVAMQCRDRDEENRTYTMQLYRLREAG